MQARIDSIVCSLAAGTLLDPYKSTRDSKTNDRASIRIVLLCIRPACLSIVRADRLRPECVISTIGGLCVRLWLRPNRHIADAADHVRRKP